MARRLTERECLLALCERLNALRASLLRVAAEHAGTVMPGYTFGQQA